MKRDEKGRFTKALTKVKPQPPTDIRLARKLDRIDQVRRKLNLVRAALIINTLFLVTSGMCVVAGPLFGSIPVGAAGVFGIFWRMGEFRQASAEYWKYRATHARLLKGAEQLTDKLLAEECIIDSDS